MPRQASRTAGTLVDVSRRLGRDVGRLRFSAPVTHVYNPLAYAREPHEAYLERFGAGPKEILLLGMNPGPFGMVQTGVPFGDVSMVRDWLGLRGHVGRPDPEHARRPVHGFECRRSEVSGSRLWGWARDRFVQPERFFERFFVINYCPLAFLEESGRNFTPDRLPVAEREPLLAACDAALADMIALLRPRYLLGIGAFAEKRLRAVVPDDHAAVLGSVLHPSPASPRANRGWASEMDRGLAAVGITC